MTRRMLISVAIAVGLLIGVFVAHQFEMYRERVKCWSVPWWSINGPFDGCDGPIIPGL